MGQRQVNETMAHALADEQRRGRKSPWQRLGRNIIRLPARVARDVSRWADPNFRLEREADRIVNRWLSASQRKALESIVGTSANHECRLLAYLANVAPVGGIILEIGAWKGKSTAWLVEGSTRREEPLPVVSVDPHACGSWETFNDTVQRFELVNRGLEVHRAGSHEVGEKWTRPLSLLWVDGSHEYDDVVRDIGLFTPHVIAEGWIIFDDAVGGLFPGVEQAIREEMTTARGFYRIAVIRHLQVFQRAPKPSTHSTRSTG